MLIGSFAFANTNNVKKSYDELVIIELEDVYSNVTNVIVLKTCRYKILNSRGEKVGDVEITDVPDNVNCGSSEMKDYALDSWNNQ